MGELALALIIVVAAAGDQDDRHQDDGGGDQNSGDAAGRGHEAGATLSRAAPGTSVVLPQLQPAAQAS